MGMNRRELLRMLGVSGAVAWSGRGQSWAAASEIAAERHPILAGDAPLIVSTWRHGQPANAAGMKLLRKGGSALDAVEAGARVSEADPEVSSVGRGGSPNEEGVVQLDAAVMDGPTHRAGAVAALERTLHPVSVARAVMETTRHVLLVGEGAQKFARRNGFKDAELLTDAARRRWLHWRRRLNEQDNWLDTEENHDTIGLVSIDGNGGIAAACTTSGLGWKIPGRVGDSPLVGHGLYADQEVGAAAATGLGEAVIRSAGSFLVVEKMRQGYSPEAACLAALQRIREKEGEEFAGQVAFVAINRDGTAAGASLRKGFRFAVARGARNLMIDGVVLG